jgi:hypothetical protein
MKPYLVVFLSFTFLSASCPAAETAAKPGAGSAQTSLLDLPYSRQQTLQTFTKTVHGGLQLVVAKSNNDTMQIKLIQSHLFKIANQFRKGDFSVTERMHGPKMPGLAQLKTAQTDDIKFEYKSLMNGAQIHYTSEYPQYVQALHEWFDAQSIEHGNDQIPGVIQHPTSPSE